MALIHVMSDFNTLLKHFGIGTTVPTFIMDLHVTSQPCGGFKTPITTLYFTPGDTNI